MLALALLMLLACGLYSINSELVSEHFGQKLDKMKTFTHVRSHSYKKKAEVLMELFFPPPVQADLSDINESTYPRPYNMGSITRNEIARAVFKSPSKKAPGLDDIPNLVLQRTVDIMLPIYEKLFNRYLETGCCPQHFQISITIALRKPDKGDYTSSKA